METGIKKKKEKILAVWVEFKKAWLKDENDQIVKFHNKSEAMAYLLNQNWTQSDLIKAVVERKVQVLDSRLPKKNAKNKAIEF